METEKKLEKGSTVTYGEMKKSDYQGYYKIAKFHPTEVHQRGVSKDFVFKKRGYLLSNDLLISPTPNPVESETGFYFYKETLVYLLGNDLEIPEEEGQSSLWTQTCTHQNVHVIYC